MAFTRPTIQQIISRIQADIESRLDGSNPRVRRSLLDIIARMDAGVAHGIYGDLDWLARNLLPDTTDADVLARWADIFGVPRLTATLATGNITITGTNGRVVPAGALFVGANGADYVLQTDATISAGTSVGVVTAVIAGVDGNLSAGSAMTLQAPVSGVNSSAIVAVLGITGGTDIETLDAWRDRLGDRIREQPQGGAARDYVRWARDSHPAVTDVWIHERADGAGSVAVRFMTYGATTNGIPTAPVVAAVNTYIQDRRPVTAVVNVLAPVAQVLNVSISNLSPNTQAVRDAIAAEIKSLLLRVAAPGVKLPVSQLREAISRAPGEVDHRLLSPTADVVVPAGSILVPGVVLWS